MPYEAVLYQFFQEDLKSFLNTYLNTFEYISMSCKSKHPKEVVETGRALQEGLALYCVVLG